MNTFHIDGGDVFVNKHHVGWLTSRRTKEQSESESLDHRDVITYFYRLKNLPLDGQMMDRNAETVRSAIPFPPMVRTGYLQFTLSAPVKKDILLMLGA